MRPNLIFESNTPLSPFLKLGEWVGSPLAQVIGGVAGKSRFVPFHRDVACEAGRLHVEAFHMRLCHRFLVLKCSLSSSRSRETIVYSPLRSFGGSDKLPRKFCVNKRLLLEESGAGTMETILFLWECSVPPSPLPLIYLVFARKLGLL